MYKITIEKLKERNWIKEFKYQNDVREMFADYLDIDISQIPENKPELAMFKKTKYNNNTNLNIILVIMESVADDLLQYNSTEFNILGELKKHFDKDITFYNCLFSYGSTTSSIEIIFQSMLRVPKLANRKEHHFINSELKNIIDTYRLNNYFTTCISVIHYPVNFDNEIVNLEDDEYRLNKVFDILSQNNQKQFIFVVTKTNHQPFDIPDNYVPLEIKFPQNFDVRDNMTLKRLQAHQYSCQKIGEFLTKLKESEFANNTIVVMTGDHYSRIKYSDNLIINKSVPLYLYIPEKLKPEKEKIDTTRIVSHIDIMPTLYELSLSSVTYYSMGTNIFDENYQNAISSNYNNGIIVNKDDMCFYNFKTNEIINYKLTKEKNKLTKYVKTEQTQKHKKMVKQYKAAVAISQYMLEETDKNNK